MRVFVFVLCVLLLVGCALDGVQQKDLSEGIPVEEGVPLYVVHFSNQESTPVAVQIWQDNRVLHSANLAPVDQTGHPGTASIALDLEQGELLVRVKVEGEWYVGKMVLEPDDGDHVVVSVFVTNEFRAEDEHVMVYQSDLPPVYD